MRAYSNSFNRALGSDFFHVIRVGDSSISIFVKFLHKYRNILLIYVHSSLVKESSNFILSDYSILIDIQNDIISPIIIPYSQNNRTYDD